VAAAAGAEVAFGSGVAAGEQLAKTIPPTAIEDILRKSRRLRRLFLLDIIKFLLDLIVVNVIKGHFNLGFLF